MVPSTRTGNRIQAQHHCVQAALIVAAVLLPGCATTQDAQQHREKLRSLASTAATVSEAWLDGHVSQRYARAALRRTYALVGLERDEIEKPPQRVIDADGRRLSDASAQLRRTVAVLIERMSAGDADAVRQAAKDIPSMLAESH